MICFNPRTHEGYDHNNRFLLLLLNSFNHRTHKGYDKSHPKRKNKLSALIPVPIKGTIKKMEKVYARSFALIPVPMKGTITVYYDIVKPLMSFNPRTHEGYDNDFFTNEKLPFNSFNPRTREGYDTSILLAFFENIILIPVPTEGTMLLKIS